MEPEYTRDSVVTEAIEAALKELVNAEWLFILSKRKGKGSGEHVSLNPRKVAEI